MFMNGCNCSQAVFLAFADKYGIDKDTALKIASSFGGGMGRSREVCGALSGMLMVCGMETGSADIKNTYQKAENYRVARELMDAFREENGSIYCRELLGLAQNTKESHVPEARTPQYYKKRPCAEIVHSAALILEDKFE